MDSGVHAPSSPRGASIQWLGVEWQGGHYALPLSSVGAVFRAEHSERLAEQKILDIEIHAGAAVFLRSFASCFDLSARVQQADMDEERRWVVVLPAHDSSSIACRVHQVVGPFWAEVQAGRVTHAGHDWSLVRPRSLSSA